MDTTAACDVMSEQIGDEGRRGEKRRRTECWTETAEKRHEKRVLAPGSLVFDFYLHLRA